MDPRRARPTSAPASPWFWAAAALALALVLAAYSNSLDNAFHFDDSHVIEQNVFVRDLRNIPRFFTDARTFSSVPANATYRPIVSTTLAIDYAIGHGLVPRPFHVSQLVLLVITGVLLWLAFVTVLERALGPSSWHRWTALLAVTLFSVHTGNTQPVNYISARSELLAAIGILGTLLVFARLPRARRWQLPIVPLAFGALAKTPAVIAAPLVLAYALLIEQQLSVAEVFTRRAWPRTRAALLETAPLFLAAAVLYVFVEHMNPPGQTYGGGGRLRYLATEAWVWIHYAKMFVLPTGLTADTDLELFDRYTDPRIFAGVLFVLALFAVMGLLTRRRDTRVAAFGLAWFAIGPVPSSTVLPLAEVANAHRVFFPFAGLALTVVSLVAGWLERGVVEKRLPRAAVALACGIAVLVLGTHAVGTYRRNRVWKSEATLWADVVRKSPGNGRAKMNLGLTEMEAGHYERAKALFVDAQRALPNYATVEVNLGIIEAHLATPEVAEPHFVRALELSPSHPAPHRYYARWLIQQGRTLEALPHLDYALRVSPADLEVRHMLMSIYAARGAPELVPLAVETLEFAADDSVSARYAAHRPPFDDAPHDAAGWLKRGLAFGDEQRHADAAQAYRAALAADSTNADAWNNLGWSLAKLGLYEDALPAFDAAERHHPGDSQVAHNRAWAVDQLADARYRQAFALQQTDRPAEAASIYRALIETYPRWVNAHYNLAYALMTERRAEEAAAEFERTLALDPSLAAAHFNLAACFDSLGRPADAERERSAYEQTRAATAAR